MNRIEALEECKATFRDNYQNVIVAALKANHSDFELQAINDMLNMALIHAYDWGYMEGMNRCEEIAKEVVNGLR